MTREMKIEPIGVIHSPFVEASGTPIQPAAADATGCVEVFEPYRAGLADLDGFERIWLLYWFDRAGPTRLSVQPYMDDQARGLFATRAPCRPNPIGISCVRLTGIEGGRLEIAEVDVLDGTPLLDIKPYAPPFDVYNVSRIGWLSGKTPAGRKADDRFHRNT
jgi:tRNA-Thr(GGU) m(6)t(6)A37 methyltransferase TsaA